MATEVFQLTVGTIVSGQYALNVFHYHIVDPTEPNDFALAEQLVSALDDGGPPTSWISRYQQLLSNDIYVSSLRAKRVFPTGGNTAGQAFTPTDFPGAVAEEVHSQQIAAVIVWPNDTEPDSFGRNFIPGLYLSAVSGGRWDSAFTTKVDAFVTKHLTGHSVSAGIFLPVIYNRLTGETDVMANGYLAPKVGTQRRRELPV